MAMVGKPIVADTRGAYRNEEKGGHTAACSRRKRAER